MAMPASTAPAQHGANVVKRVQDLGRRGSTATRLVTPTLEFSADAFLDFGSGGVVWSNVEGASINGSAIIPGRTGTWVAWVDGTVGNPDGSERYTDATPAAAGYVQFCAPIPDGDTVAGGPGPGSVLSYYPSPDIQIGGEDSFTRFGLSAEGPIDTYATAGFFLQFRDGAALTQEARWTIRGRLVGGGS